MIELLAAFLVAQGAQGLTPAMQRQLLEAFAPGDAPDALQFLAAVPGGGNASVVFACGTGKRARAIVARFEAGALQGDPVEVGEPLKACGKVAVSQAFEVRRPGDKPRRAVVATWSDGGKALLTAAITLEPQVLTWTTAAGAAGTAIVPLSRAALCVRQSDGSWDTISWQEAAGAWESGAGPCKPPKSRR